jgi:hypothetical protein
LGVGWWNALLYFLLRYKVEAREEEREKGAGKRGRKNI